MIDLIRDTISAGRMVIWEEVARDGAQAETLLTGPQRVKIGRAMAAMFGEHGPQHLVFAAGYPSIGKEEYEAIRQVVAEVDGCSLATHGRLTRGDVDLGIQVLQGARYGRVSYALPISDRHCDIMMHVSKEEALRQAVDMARYALDRSGGMPIDVALGVAARVDPAFLAETALRLSDEGITIIKVCDSTGELYPLETRRLFEGILAHIPAEKRSQVIVGSHLHNDFGLALANSLETVRLGIRMVASSWLGQGERVGLPPTEQLLFALGMVSQHLGDKMPETAYGTPMPGLEERLGVPSKPLWLTPPDLTQLVPICRMVEEMLSIPARGNDPVLGAHMNHIATGAYFNNPKAFKPFDPLVILGVPPELLLTHLANHSIIEAVANKLGYTLRREQAAEALAWVKRRAYNQQRSVISEDEFVKYLSTIADLEKVDK
jgi:2-isopropylmalate synthase